MSISDYQEELMKHSPCEKGLAAFGKCRSRKDFFELVGKPVACDYFLKSIEEGWGPDPQEFENIFRPYINGALTITFDIDNRKLHSQVWCNVDEITIDDSVRWLILIGCRGKVTIKNWQVVKIFVDRYSRIELECGRNSIVYVQNYGGKVNDVNKCCKML